MPVPALPRHPAVRAALVALALVFLLVVTTSIVKASTADAVQAEVAASAAAEAAEARRAEAAATLAAQEQAAREEAERLAILELAAARDATVASVAAAQAVLDASAGRVADDAVRVALAAAIATTSTALTGSLADLQAAAAALAGAQVAVTDAQTVWEAEQARLAAEAAAEQAAQDAAPRAAPKAVAPAAPAPAAPQCVNDSTYTGTPFYTTAPGAGGDGSNGNIPASQMTQLAWGHDTVGTPQYLRTRAAQALDRLNAAYRARFGSDLDIDLTYRSYESQVAMRNELGTIAAVPGTSTHGTGNALDVPEWSCYAFGSVRRDWLVTNGPAYGWVSPSWARQGSSNPEYWHYEFTG